MNPATAHATAREWLTLRLYGELAAHEEHALAAHLAGCADCRDFAAELERGLGALPRAEAREVDLPADWAASLEARLTGTRRRRWIRPALTFAAGLAAGVALVASLDGAGRPPAVAPLELARSLPPFVPSADAPPPARTPGTYAALATRARGQ